jgi:hypothetical protein
MIKNIENPAFRLFKKQSSLDSDFSRPKFVWHTAKVKKQKSIFFVFWGFLLTHNLKQRIIRAVFIF